MSSPECSDGSSLPSIFRSRLTGPLPMPSEEIMAMRLSPDPEVPQPERPTSQASFEDQSDYSSSPDGSQSGDDIAVDNDESRPTAIPQTGMVSHSGVEATPAATASGSTPATQTTPRVIYSADMSAGIMSLFAQYKRQGMVKGKKTKDWSAVFDAVCQEAQRRWPFYQWTQTIISNKYATEKRRYREWLNLLHEEGVAYDDATGMPVVDDKGWDLFLYRHGKTAKGCAWLRTVPLGDVTAYQTVFSEERPDGEYISTVHELINPGPPRASARFLAPTAGWGKRKQRDNNSFEANQRSQSSLRVQTTTEVIQRSQSPVRIQPTPAANQRSRSSPRVSPTTVVPGKAQATRKKLKRQSALVEAAQAINTAIKAFAKPQPPSLPEIVNAALTDLCTNYKDKISIITLLACVEVLKEPAKSQTWMLLSDEESRMGLIDEWAKKEQS